MGVVFSGRQTHRHFVDARALGALGAAVALDDLVARQVGEAPRPGFQKLVALLGGGGVGVVLWAVA